MTPYKLEEAIMSCWNVVEDIRTIYEFPDQRKMTEDELQNSLLGLMTIYQLKFEKLFDIYEQLLREGKLTLEGKKKSFEPGLALDSGEFIPASELNK